MDFELSSQQIAVLCALSNGATAAIAAEQAGVHRNTIHNWRRNSLFFQQALSEARYDRALLVREKMEALVELAVNALRQILADPATPPSVRLRAALSIIQAASTPLAPNRRFELDIEQNESALHNGAQSPVATCELSPENHPAVHNPAQRDDQPPTDAPESEAAVHNPAQAAVPGRHQKIGRNDTCPCGSGRKYKRCCLDACRSAAA